MLCILAITSNSPPPRSYSPTPFVHRYWVLHTTVIHLTHPLFLRFLPRIRRHLQHLSTLRTAAIPNLINLANKQTQCRWTMSFVVININAYTRKLGPDPLFLLAARKSKATDFAHTHEAPRRLTRLRPTIWNILKGYCKTERRLLTWNVVGCLRYSMQKERMYRMFKSGERRSAVCVWLGAQKIHSRRILSKLGNR